jgi:hypothetical protein
MKGVFCRSDSLVRGFIALCIEYRKPFGVYVLAASILKSCKHWPLSFGKGFYIILRKLGDYFLRKRKSGLPFRLRLQRADDRNFYFFRLIFVI